MYQPFYHADQYRPQHTPPSYWHATTPRPTLAPGSGEHTVDVAIVGGGYCGLSAALHLARDHGARVAVLEAGDIGWGASGRNAGFNTLPATKHDYIGLQRALGEAGAAGFMAAQQEALQLVASLAAAEGIATQACGEGSYVVAHSPAAWAGLQDEHHAWQRHTPVASRLLTRAEFAGCGHAGDAQYGALHILHGGGLNPLALASGLAQAAQRHGAILLPRQAVHAWQPHGGGHTLQAADSVVHARQLLLATNGYLPAWLPPVLRHRTLPVISNIIVTRPLSDAEWGAYAYHTATPMFDTRHLLSYWRRLPDGRLLFGARGDLCGDDASGQRQRAALQAQLAARFPAWAGVDIDYFWRGLIAVNRRLLPQYGPLPGLPGVWYAAGCFGSGVSTMPWLGRALARAMAGQPPSASEAACAMHGLAPRLPPWQAWQRLGLRLAYSGYAWRDRFSEPD